MPEPTAIDRPAPSLLCIGNITLDEAVQPDGRHTLAPGGDALFAALAARLQWNSAASVGTVTWLAPAGTDLSADLLPELEARGLVSADLPGRDLPTVRNRVEYHADGTRSWHLVHGEEHFDQMSVHPADVSPDLLEHDGVLICAMSLAAQVELTGWLRPRTAATVFLDLQEDYLAGHEQLWLDVIAGCDVFLPSEVEAIALSGSPDLDRAIRQFRDLGPHTVVIKRAEKGCLLLASGSDTVFEIPAEPVVAVDSTGAGDAFCGGFAAEYLSSGDAVAAVAAGASAATATIGGAGISGLLASVERLASAPAAAAGGGVPR